MHNEELLSHILDAHPYPIVFVDCEHIIRYMNKRARYRYYDELGYGDLIGKSVFECHQNPKSIEKIQQLFHRFQHHGGEQFLMVSPQNMRIYVTPVRDASGALVGYFERYEMNLQK